MKNKDLIIDDNFFESKLTKVESFGGMTLAENVKRVNTALVKMEPVHKNFGKSQSDFQIRVLNIGSSTSSQRSLSKISAEVQKKRDALEENKYNIMLEQVELEKLYKKLEIEQDTLERMTLEILINKTKSQLSRGMNAYEGAMKAVLSLEKAYDSQLKLCQNFNEVEFEKAEVKSHIQRTLLQSLQDMRSTGGGIGNGEQKYINSIGLNITKVRKKLLQYLQTENDQEGYSNVSMLDFIDSFSDELIPHALESIKYRGLDTEYDESIGYKENKEEK